MGNKRWFQTRFFKIVMSVALLTMYLLFTIAKFDVGETGFESFANSVHPAVAILIADIPLAGSIGYAYFAIVNK
jgi:hypothetical protein